MKPARPRSPDRDIDCQQAMNDRLFALMNEAAEAGWSEREVAEAVQELTLAWRRWRREKRHTDAQVAAARTLRQQ